jgi:endonuclease YncB( thermonuclease family)
MQEDLSADDYPATYGGVLLCCTYTLIITGRFLFDALLRPLLHALCLSCVMVVGFVRAQPAVLMLPLHAFWTLLAIAHRRWRDLTLRHKAPYMLGVLVYGACCAIRFLVWFVSWVQCRAWWAAPDKCILYLAALLPIAVPAVQKGLRALLTLRNIGERPVWLPMVCRPLPKILIWWTHVQLGRFYRASWPRWLLRCFVCYMLFSYGMINTPPTGMALTHCIHVAILNVVAWSTSSSPEPLDPRAEDPHIAHCTTRNTPRFMPAVRRGKVTTVYDGDTLTVAARHGSLGVPYLFNVRLSGIDAPEIRGAISAGEKRAAFVARDALRAAILGELVTLTVYRFDKYGRLLAAVAHDSKGDMSRWMLEAGHARPYHGGRREAWELEP